MTNTYFYSIVTCTPHPVRDERINLGVVLVSEDGVSADFKFKRSYVGQLKALAPDIRVETVSSFIRDFSSRFVSGEGVVRGGDEMRGTFDVLQGLSNNRGGQISFTGPKAFVADRDFEEALNDLFQMFVGPLPHYTKEGVGRKEVRRSVRLALRKWKVKDKDILSEPQIIGLHGLSNLDLGILSYHASDTQIALAMEPISFFIDSALDIQRQRDHVAWVRSDSAQVPDAPHICAILTKPANSHTELFKESRRLFSNIGVSVVITEEIESLQPILEASGARMSVDI